MSKDKALEELFLAQKPHFDDNADFMAALTRRLDAVEYVRQHQEATIRRYKMAMVAAFVTAGFCGLFSDPLCAGRQIIAGSCARSGRRWLSRYQYFGTA